MGRPRQGLEALYSQARAEREYIPDLCLPVTLAVFAPLQSRVHEMVPLTLRVGLLTSANIQTNLTGLPGLDNSSSEARLPSWMMLRL